MISSMPKWIGDLFAAALRPNVTIVTTSYISCQIKKIRLRGNISGMNFQIGYASVIRVSETEYRNYTVAAYDTHGGTLDIIFHIHGHGVGSRYIDALKTGDELFISDPRGKKLYDAGSKQQYLFGDETSLGTACSLLPVLKKNQLQFHFYFELAEENKDVPQLLGLENCTVFPKNGLFRNEKNIVALKTPDWQAANFIVTGNVTSIQTLRTVLKGTTTGKILSQGYWLEGKKGL
jgi:NADPH-dependent ferric siderophore reductase